MRALALIVLLAVAAAMSATAQFLPVLNPGTTNLYYHGGEFLTSIAPNMSFNGLAIGQHVTRSFGYSLETEYWQTAYTGTGIETGMYDYHNARLGIDHISVMQNVRIVPFSDRPFLGRFATGLKLGAETYFIDGSKDVCFGLEEWFTISKKVRLQGEIMDHWYTNPALDRATGKLALQWMF